MDRIIENQKRIKPKHYRIIILSGLIIAAFIFTFLRNPVSTLKVEKDRLSIGTVIEDNFQDYIKVNGHVEPITTIYLDATEGGRIERILIEEGSMVTKGDVILELSNENLNLEILESESDLAERSNELREVRILMEQQKLDLDRDILRQQYGLVTRERNYNQNKSLYDQRLISEEEYLRAKEEVELARELMKMLRTRQQQDSVFRAIQIEQMEYSLKNMRRNLNLVSQRSEALKIKAPVDGQLGLLAAELGQLVVRGNRLGQIHVLTSYKIEGEIDEHYIDRVRPGLEANFERQSDTFHLLLKKVYPEVREGQFTVDLNFVGNTPGNMRTGQTYYLNLQLGQAQRAVMVPRGGFFQSTGGQWVMVVNEAEGYALRRPIRIGRQNSEYYEVLEGLAPGEKVILSGNEYFDDNEKLKYKE